jgi:hypothetical protein
MSAGVRGQWSIPFGFASRDVAFISSGAGATLAIDSNLSWSDLFNPGWGAGLTVDLTMYRVGKGSGYDSGYGKSRGKVAMGGYLSINEVHYDGNSTSDSFNNSITPDQMVLSTAVIGPMIFQDMGDGAFAEGRFGIGVAHYSECGATYRAAPFAAVRGQLFEETWTLATEFKGAAGFQLGPLAVSLGIGAKLLLPPNRASGVDLDPGLFWSFDVELGVDLGF